MKMGDGLFSKLKVLIGIEEIEEEEVEEEMSKNAAGVRPSIAKFCVLQQQIKAEENKDGKSCL